ncbi:hypothetical protein FoTM2_014743 [Fusarium oxysporum f. sp. vasinfectum]|uniref:Uncharacterized protein n=1 Tax=Fusarium oxysporum f. sp. vasinfectum 25433 TaxID=1089449 RepID=X0KJW3_FUSOX|nr:hypothetical protein FOTG_17650 [Fusarium oxysporum f. sp. vasinfectum 25433]KAK2924465.1 hypothetical protein FoTM2_014743 [Fusarium oxysporum f. sp. vasinfectum]
MSPGQRKRGWRQCLADSYEKQYGPLDDPVPTFGAKLVTFPSTPTLPMCLAGPDPDFLEQLDRLLYAIGPNSVPKCLQRQRFSEPLDEESSDDDTDDEHNERFRDSIREVYVRMYAKAGIDIVAVEARRRARRHAREERREARAAESNSTKSALPSSHDHAIKPPSNANEADAAGYQVKHQKRKRQTDDEEDEPRRKVARLSDTTTARPKRRIRPPFKPKSSYSPPQTPSPTERDHAQGKAGSPSSPESLVAQQPTPEVDNSSRFLKLERGQESPTAGGELSAG